MTRRQLDDGVIEYSILLRSPKGLSWYETRITITETKDDRSTATAAVSRYRDYGQSRWSKPERISGVVLYRDGALTERTRPLQLWITLLAEFGRSREPILFRGTLDCIDK